MAQITQTISTPPSAPVAGSPTFDAQADACINHFKTMQDEYTNFATQANDLGVEISANAASSEQSANDAAASATAAAATADGVSALSSAAEEARDEAIAAKDTTLAARDIATAASATATNAADAASASAASVNPGTDPEQIVRAGDLGTAAWLDQTWLFKSTTWNAPSCTNAAQVSTTLEVPGAEIGDTVDARASVALSGLHLRGEATAANVVTLYLSNLTGAAVDLPSATYYVAVLKRTPTR